MIVVIDNYDSFVYNLARYIEQLGQEVTIIRNDEKSVIDIFNLNPSHIILSPGPCTPSEAGISIELVKSLPDDLPLLGVCLGHQVIGQAFGANITRAIRPLHGQSSMLEHDKQGLFRKLPSPLKVGRYHSLIISQQGFPSDLNITALSEEGEIMAIQHKQRPIYGVQFHPESILTEAGYSLLRNFLLSST